MDRTLSVRLCLAVLVLAALFSFASSADAVLIELPNSTANLVYSNASLGTLTGPILDAAGNLYVTADATASPFTFKVTPDGAASTWSTTWSRNLVLGPDGNAYGVGAQNGIQRILKFSPGGASSVLHTDSLAWNYAAVLPDGSLYSDVWLGTGVGLYSVDRMTGQPTVVFAGGPGPGGAGTYDYMAVGSDGRLYVNGTDASGRQLFRLDGTTLTRLITPPHGEVVVAPGPAGRFLAISAVPGSAYWASYLWLYDPVSGSSTLVARTDVYFHEYDVTFGGAAYDAARKTVYVTENHRIWALHLDLTTPVGTTTWGALKARYR